MKRAAKWYRRGFGTPAINSPGGLIGKGERRASLQEALGNVLSVLGERESGTGRLEEAVEAFRAALEKFDAAGILWSRDHARTGLAMVLQKLQERVLRPV